MPVVFDSVLWELIYELCKTSLQNWRENDLITLESLGFLICKILRSNSMYFQSELPLMFLVKKYIKRVPGHY